MKITRYRIYLGPALLALALSLNSCLHNEQRTPGLASCPERPNYLALTCDGEDRAKAFTLRRTLYLCDGGLNGTTRPISAEQIRHCLTELTEEFAALRTLPCQEVFVDHTRCVLKSGIKKEVGMLIHSEGDLNSVLGEARGRLHTDDLVKFLEDLASWYRQTSASVYQSDALKNVKTRGINLDPNLPLRDQVDALAFELVDQDQQEVLNSFWKSVADQSKSDELLARNTNFYTTTAASLQVALGVLNWNNYPTPLFLDLLGSSLKALSDRVYYLAGITDLGCEIDSCRTNTNTELYRIISLLGSLGTPQEFVQRAGEIDRINGSIAPVFRALLNQRESIERGIRGLIESRRGNLEPLNQGQDILTIRPARVPSLARDILGIIQANRDLSLSYRNSGFYLWNKDALLEFGLGTNLNGIGEIIRESSARLEVAQRDFENRRQAYGQRVFEQRQWNHSVAHLRSELERQLERVSEIGEDLIGLRANLTDLHERRTAYLQDVLRTLESESYKARYGSRFTADPEKNLVIRPSAAPLNIRAALIGELSLPGQAPIQLKKGEVATIQVQGNWSPTCALLRSNFKEESVRGAQIGPEGFMLSVIEGDTVVESAAQFKRHDKATQKGIRNSICVGQETGAIKSIFGVRADVSSCTEFAFHEADSSGWTNDQINSSETRSQAAFSLGVRSPEAPFSTLPAGSLLIAQVRRVAEPLRIGDILSIHVAQRTNQIVVDRDSDLYFIVNDCRGEQVENAGSLDLTYQIRRPEGETAPAVANAMAQSIQLIDERTDAILAQGDLSAQQMNALRAMMMQTLAAHPEGRSRETLGPVLSEFFHYWVENEILELETKSRIKRLERSIRIEIANLKRIEANIKRTQSLTEFHELQRLWALDLADIRLLTAEMTSAIQVLSRYAIPTIRFLSPARIEELKQKVSVRFIREQLTPETSVDQISKSVRDLYGDVVLVGLLDRLIYRDWETKDVVLSFPKPELILRDAGRQPNQHSELSPWKKGPRAMTERIWNAFLGAQGDRSVVLSLNPEDLYGLNSADPRSLHCNNLSPVIEKMGLHFLTREEADGVGSNLGFTIPIHAEGSLKFPLETHLQTFTMVGDGAGTWLNQEIPYTAGPLEQVLSVLNARNGKEVEGGAGLSPFMDFHFNFDASAFSGGKFYAPLLPQVREILVLFRVKYRPSRAQTLPWMPACAGLNQ